MAIEILGLAHILIRLGMSSRGIELNSETCSWHPLPRRTVNRSGWRNNKSDGYTSVPSKIAAVAIQDPEAATPRGGEVQKCEEVDLGCGAACSSQVWENRIQEAIAVVFTDCSRGESGGVAGG